MAKTWGQNERAREARHRSGNNSSSVSSNSGKGKHHKSGGLKAWLNDEEDWWGRPKGGGKGGSKEVTGKSGGLGQALFGKWWDG